MYPKNIFTKMFGRTWYSWFPCLLISFSTKLPNECAMIMVPSRAILFYYENALCSCHQPMTQSWWFQAFQLFTFSLQTGHQPIKKDFWFPASTCGLSLCRTPTSRWAHSWAEDDGQSENTGQMNFIHIQNNTF